MDITERSTSPLMRDIFGSDLSIILNDYNGCIKELAGRHLYIKNVFSDCLNRTGFLLPYMSAEYGYYSIKGRFMPPGIKKAVTGFGLIGLSISIDDDIADEYAGNHLKTVYNISASELIQNLGYTLIFRNSRPRERDIIISETGRAVSSTAKYQSADALNIMNFQKNGFNLANYLYAAKKTACPIKYGLRLGMILAEGHGFLPTAETVGERLGIVLQMIDDVIDLKEDIINYKGNVTLPMFLLHNGLSFSRIFSMIDYSINECVLEARKVPFSGKLEQMIGGFVAVRSIARQKLYPADKTLVFHDAFNRV
jgi:hypothetical protein